MALKGALFMILRWIFYTLYLCSGFVPTAYSLETLSPPPLDHAEVSILETHLLDNITTQQKPFIKAHSQPIIHSIPGAVLASPSFKSPEFSQDYQFHWMRDAAITLHQIATLYLSSSEDDKKALRPYLINYLLFETKAQQQISKPGEQSFGQPKFNVDGSIWEGKWWRPQNDSPALRAITALELYDILNNEKDNAHKTLALDIAKNDLIYLTKIWRRPTYDIWEETLDTDHFFTKIMQRKAFLDAIPIFNALHEEKLVRLFQKTANAISVSLEKHWNVKRGYITETINQQYYKGGGLNTSIILAALYGNPQQTNNNNWTVTDPRVMSTVYYLRNAFAMLYLLNIKHPNTPPLLGRYPNDIYDGKKFDYGNPWVLTTNALAQFYYELGAAYRKNQVIIINSKNILFFQQINAGVKIKPGIIRLKTQPKLFSTILYALIHQGDAIIKNVKQYGVCEYQPQHLPIPWGNKTSCLHFSEQVDRTTGKAVSAQDLTWGYVTFLAAMHAREHFLRLNS